MNIVPDPKVTVGRMLHRAAEADAPDWRRSHLGASQIGHECRRKLWLGFRWASEPVYEATLSAKRIKEAWFEEDCLPGRMHELFQTGNDFEEVAVSLLRKSGFDVWEQDPNTGEQFLVSWGHFGGHTDGVIRNSFDQVIDIRFVEPGTKNEIWYPWQPQSNLLLEIKSYNRLRFQDMRRTGVAVSDPKYYDQVQVYMHGLIEQQGAKLDGCLFFATCKDDNRVEAQYVPYVEKHAAPLVQKGLDLCSTDKMPPPAWPDPEAKDAWQCRFCEHEATCRGGKLPLRSCRTCVSSEAGKDGSWYCHKGAKPAKISSKDQTAAPPLSCHRYLPDLVPGDAVDASDEDRWVRYRLDDGSEWVDRGPEWALRPIDNAPLAVAAAFDGYVEDP